MAKFDLVFEGGGAKGIAFAGALEEFFRQGHSVRRVIGTSAGAISATLLAAGYTSAELLAAVTERLPPPDNKPRFSTFMDRPKDQDFSETTKNTSETMEALRKANLLQVFGVVAHVPGVAKVLERLEGNVLDVLLKTPLYAQLFSFVECGGLFVGREFLNWFQQKLAQKNISATDTLKTFAQKTGADLSVVASDTQNEEMLILNHRTAPDCPVAWAVRMSMSIPFIWQEVVWKEEWGLYLGRKKAGNAIVDGGALSNFPIRLIAESDAAIREIMGDTDPLGAANLGLLIDETLPVPGVTEQEKPKGLVPQLRTVQRAMRLVDTITGASDNAEIQRREKEICRVPAKSYGTTEFDMSTERLNALIEGGRQAMKTHLATRHLV